MCEKPEVLSADVIPIGKYLKPNKFIPLTGNPENGDYMDYLRSLPDEEPVILVFPAKSS